MEGRKKIQKGEGSRVEEKGTWEEEGKRYFKDRSWTFQIWPNSVYWWCWSCWRVWASWVSWVGRDLKWRKVRDGGGPRWLEQRINKRRRLIESLNMINQKLRRSIYISWIYCMPIFEHIINSYLL